MTNARGTLFEGSRAVSPILLGVVPFGLITGAATVSAGLSDLSAIGMSVAVFAGTAQLATVQLLTENAPFLVIVATALVINLRFVMYSATLAPHFQTLSFRWKGPLAYLLSDQAFVVSMPRFPTMSDGLRKWFYLGAAATLWTTWQFAFAIGVFVGARLPESWSLDFAVPLTLLALMPATIRDTASLVTIGATALGVVLFHALPLNLGIIASVVLGVGVGWLFLRRTSWRKAVAS
jgi:predicted branched-subunit amino acid permease